MINKLVNQFRPRRVPNQASHWHAAREAFATWQRVGQAKDTARISADHQKLHRLSLLSAVAWRRYLRRLQRCIFLGKPPWTKEFSQS